MPCPLVDVAFKVSLQSSKLRHVSSIGGALIYFLAPSIRKVFSRAFFQIRQYWQFRLLAGLGSSFYG